MLRLTRDAVLLLGVFAASACKHKPPAHELCVIGDNTLLCDDPRESPMEYERTWDESVNYICTNPDDFENVRSWVDRKLTEKR